MKQFILSLLGMAVFGMSFADEARAADKATPEAGSLLVFSEFDNRQGVFNAVTVTNTNGDAVNGTIDVHYFYVDHETCLTTDRTRRLTPNDTLTVLPFIDNPNSVAGYLYVFAKSKTTGQAVSFNHLVGSNLIIEGLGLLEYSQNPFSFCSPLPEGQPTDLDSDGIRDLNGSEYVQAPDQLIVPRFFGQHGRSHSDLVLINLTGGARFDAIVDFLVYNDNEEAFSAQYQFDCWEKVALSNISNVFLRSFLLSTNHNQNEIQGAQGLETGWFEMDGNLAFSTTTSIADPAFLAVLVEGTGACGASDLPFGRGQQANGDLLPLGPFGDQ